MKEYLNLTKEELKDYVLHSSKIEEILSDPEFKSHILKPENHYAFVWLVQDLEDKYINKFLDNSFLEVIIDTDSRAEDKYNAIMYSYDEIFLNATEKILNYILDSNRLNNYFSYFKLDVAYHILNYIVFKRRDKIWTISRFDEKIQSDLLTLDVIEKLYYVTEFDEIFLTLSAKSISKLLTFDKYKNIVLDFTLNEMTHFSYKMRNENFVVFNNNSTFILNIASIENPNYYRYIVNNLLINNYELVEKIERYRKIYVKKQFELVNDKGIFLSNIKVRESIKESGISKSMLEKIHPSFHTTEESDMTDEFLFKITRERQFEMLCDVYFKDYAQNVLYNINEIIKFNSKEKQISDEMIALYSKFINFDKLNSFEINNLVSKMNDNDYCSMLYDDYRKCKEHSFKLFKNNLLKVDKDSKLYNEEMSLENGMDVYYLNGEDFFACVHCGYYNMDYTFPKTISLSFIGTENIGVYNKGTVIVGFDTFSLDRIMHVYNSDSFTAKTLGTPRVNHIFTPKEMLEKTNGYNEILYSEKNGSNLKPSYIICFDDIDYSSKLYAQENNLPILLINSKKYKFNNNTFSSENYQDSYSKESGDYFDKKM